MKESNASEACQTVDIPALSAQRELLEARESRLLTDSPPRAPRLSVLSSDKQWERKEEQRDDDVFFFVFFYFFKAK